MTASAHFFDPALESLLTRQLTDSGITWTDNNLEIRQLFYQLNQPELHSNTLQKAYDFIQNQLQQVAQRNESKLSADYCVDSLSDLQAGEIPPVLKYLCTEDNITRCLDKTSVVMLTQPSWLQNISPAVASQSRQSVQLMSLYLQLTQKGKQNVDLQQSYHALLLAKGIKIPNLHSNSFCLQAEQLPATFEFATLQLALSRFPRGLFPEILGFTLAFCQAPTLIEACFPDQHTASPFFQQHQHQVKANITPLRLCINAYLDVFPRQTQSLWQRIQKGFCLYQQLMQNSCQQFSNTLRLSSTTHQAVASLLQKKAFAAIGHHQKIQLQGQSLDKWFAELPANTEQFLQALLHSDYIDQQNPANSQLLSLFDFNGPMFGVLTQSERDTLQSWLQDELKASKDTVEPDISHANISHYSFSATQPVHNISTQSLKPEACYAKSTNRELYYYLVNQDLFPDVLTTAKTKVRKLLRACAFFTPLPFKHYSHEPFSRYIENSYQQEIQAYTPLQGAPKISKEAYIWGFEQIAPMILIDGCWLQNSLALQPVNPEISDILFNIYRDEIGCGQLEQNHPYIFQQLLDSLSIYVPPAFSREFSEHPGFIKSAFDLPVYMLALSSFTVEFLPELLGLNMAIELSGLGKSYQRLVDDWNYWGIDPSIANIHISIDNYASGHTYQAKQAIQLYMDEIMQRSTQSKVLDTHWKRIYTGYASLRFVGGRFKYGLPFWYFYHKYMAKI